MRISNQRIFPFLILTILVYSCWQSCAALRSNSGPDAGNENISASPKIIFLNYSVKPGKLNGTTEIHLIDKTIVSGNLKTNLANTEIPKPGDLRCVTLDNHLNPIDSILVSDPLNITTESTNENNQFFKKEITKDSAQFSIRLQLNEKIYAIGIRKNVNSGDENSFLVITKLK